MYLFRVCSALRSNTNWAISAASCLLWCGPATECVRLCGLWMRVAIVAHRRCESQPSYTRTHEWKCTIHARAHSIHRQTWIAAPATTWQRMCNKLRDSQLPTVLLLSMCEKLYITHWMWHEKMILSFVVVMDLRLCLFEMPFFFSFYFSCQFWHWFKRN